MSDEAAWPALMAAAQGGDPQAYRRLLKEIIPVVRALVRRRVYDPALVEDVIQDVLLAAHRVRHTYDPSCPFLPWIGAITAARSIDALRRHGRARRREINDDSAMQSQPDERAARQIDGIGAGSELDQLLGVLPARQRQVVEMVKLHEMSLEEAAQASHLSVSAIKALLHRALGRLRSQGRTDHEP